MPKKPVQKPATPRNVVGRPPARPPTRQSGEQSSRAVRRRPNGPEHQQPISNNPLQQAAEKIGFFGLTQEGAHRAGFSGGAGAALTPAQQTAANMLKATVRGAVTKGGGGGTGIANPDGTISGGNPAVNGGHSVRGPIQRQAAQAGPSVADALADYAEALNGRPVDAESYNSWTAQQKYDYAEAVVALNTNQALGGLPLALNVGLGQIGNQVAGNMHDLATDVAANVSDTASQALQTATTNLGAFAQQVTNLARQTGVGGTKGTPRPVDRSEANKRAWETRKKLYGSSGQKEK